MKVSIKDGKISNQTMIVKRLGRFEVRIVDESNGFKMDFVKKKGGWILECHSRRGSSTLKKDGFGTCI